MVKMKMSKFNLVFLVLLTATTIWGIAFLHTLQEYYNYCESLKETKLGLPEPYHLWNAGLYITIATDFLLIIWIPFTAYSVRKKVYPYLKQHLTYQNMKRFFQNVSRLAYERFYNLVLYYFRTTNRKVKSSIALWYMKYETLEHVDLLTKVLKWIVLPASLFYFFSAFYFLEENVLASIFFGLLIFLYSNFLPDLPAVFRRKVRRGTENKTDELCWYKKYALLLLAPLFIGVLFCGQQLGWKTAANFHNFKSLAIYGAFLFTLSFIAFGDFPISAGDVTQILSIPLYGLTGYLTHLKVDKIW
jgi:hypothetical protein